MNESQQPPRDERAQSKESEMQSSTIPRQRSLIQKIGAATVTFVILYMLLGIPVYLLFRVFFGE